MERLQALKTNLAQIGAVLENSDFKDGASARRYWEKEFVEALTLSDNELGKWAEFTLECLGDFKDSVYYLKEEIEDILNRIVKLTKDKRGA